MRAVVVSAFGGFEQLRLVDMPQPEPGAGQVLVKMIAAAINPLDNLIRLGAVTLGKQPPFILGNEGAGIITSSGSDLSIGTRVMFREAYNLPNGGTWQEYVLAPREAVVPLPDGVSMLEAAALRTGFMTAYLALVYRAKLRPGQIVFAPAVGSSVGNAVIQLGRALGAAQVITTAGSHAKAERARELGYTDVIDLSKETITAGIARLTGNAGVDVMVDGLGGDFTRQGMAALKRGGVLMLVGSTADQEAHFDIAHFMLKDVRILGMQAAFAPRDVAVEGFRTIFTLWQEGHIHPVVDRTFPVEQVIEAQRYQVAARPFGKVLLTFAYDS